MTGQDHYETLQVSPIADPTVIAAAYRRLALLYHPDRNNSPQATDMMARVNVAYEILRDPKKRAEYDREGGPQSSVGQRVNQDTRSTENRYGDGSQYSDGARTHRQTGGRGARDTRDSRSSGGRGANRENRQKHTPYEAGSSTSYYRDGTRPAGDQDAGIGFFGLGATRQAVIEVQGQAERVNVNHLQNKETWYYGRSTVEFSISTGTVRRWADLARNLRVKMVPGQRVTASPKFGLGSHKDDVIRLQGTPSRIDMKAANRETWCFGYGNSTVDFQNPAGLVVGWRDIEKILMTGGNGGERTRANNRRPYGQTIEDEGRAYNRTATGKPNTAQGNWSNQEDRYGSRVKTAAGKAGHDQGSEPSGYSADGQDWSWVASGGPSPRQSRPVKKFLCREGIGTKLKVAAVGLAVAGILIVTGQGNILVALLGIAGGIYFLQRRWKGRKS